MPVVDLTTKWCILIVPDNYEINHLVGHVETVLFCGLICCQVAIIDYVTARRDRQWQVRFFIFRRSR